MEKALFKNIKKAILTDLQNSKSEICIAVAWFTNHEFYNVLLKKMAEGIKVTLIIINDPVNNREGGLNWQHFINAGGELHFSHYPKIMHHKFCIIDNEILYNGSYNWTYYAEKINRENTIRHIDKDELINDFKIEFESLKQQNKKYKRVKQHTLEDLLNFQLDKAFNFYISKELQANSRWLVKNKRFEIADKVLSASIKFSNQKEKGKIEPVKARINSLSRQIVKAQLLNTTVNRELNQISRQTSQLINKINKTRALNPTFPSNPNIISNQNKLAELKKHEQLLKSLKREKFQGDFGELRINLKWDTFDDLDLHVFDPSKNHIYYSAKEAFSNGSKGQLDVDANAGSDKRLDPQENIFWETNPPSGIYKIIVVHYSEKQHKEVPFILSIISQKGKSKIIYAKVHHDNFKCMLVAEIRYVRGQGITEIIEKKTLTTV